MLPYLYIKSIKHSKLIMSPAIPENQTNNEDMWRCMCPMDHAPCVIQCGRCGADEAKALRALCEDELCEDCGWRCEFPQSHFEYGSGPDCRVHCAHISRTYHMQIDLSVDETVYTHRLTGEVHRVPY
jgi:hypothetical protein